MALVLDRVEAEPELADRLQVELRVLVPLVPVGERKLGERDPHGPRRPARDLKSLALKGPLLERLASRAELRIEPVLEGPGGLVRLLEDEFQIELLRAVIAHPELDPLPAGPVLL